MKNAKKILALALVCAFAFAPLLIPSGASACSCIMQPDLNEDALAGASAVFAGTFVSSTPVENGKVLTFDVSKTWKGPNTKTITAHTPNDSAACGWDPETGKEYLVYAYMLNEQLETGTPGDLHINLCSRTFLLADAENDLAALGEGKVPVAETPAGAQGEDGPNLLVKAGAALIVLVVIGAVVKALRKGK
ncbi:MAG TPA: hypothetical protein VGE62_00900 [Candidatus Paceibacterota bacterium]